MEERVCLTYESGSKLFTEGSQADNSSRNLETGTEAGSVVERDILTGLLFRCLLSAVLYTLKSPA